MWGSWGCRGFMMMGLQVVGGGGVWGPGSMGV